MTRCYHGWHSPALGRDMEMLVFGHAGAALIVFPTSTGGFSEYEDRGMVDAVRDKLERGDLQLFCLSSVDAESWCNRRAHPRQRLDRHLQYEGYVLNEVVPFVRHLNPQAAVGVTGCSFGAYHAMVLALRHPTQFGSCITMGGAFDVTPFLDGFSDEDAYLLNPTRFLPNLSDRGYLDRFRHIKWVLATGEQDICRDASEGLAAVLTSKRIPHSLHVWGQGSKHDWPDWRPMAAAYLP